MDCFAQSGARSRARLARNDEPGYARVPSSSQDGWSASDTHRSLFHQRCWVSRRAQPNLRTLMRVGALGVSVKSFDRPARQLRFEPPSHRLEPPTSATAAGGSFAPAPTDHSLDGPAYKPATGSTFPEFISTISRITRQSRRSSAKRYLCVSESNKTS